MNINVTHHKHDFEGGTRLRNPTNTTMRLKPVNRYTYPYEYQAHRQVFIWQPRATSPKTNMPIRKSTIDSPVVFHLRGLNRSTPNRGTTPKTRPGSTPTPIASQY